MRFGAVKACRSIWGGRSDFAGDTQLSDGAGGPQFSLPTCPSILLLIDSCDLEFDVATLHRELESKAYALTGAEQVIATDLSSPTTQWNS